MYESVAAADTVVATDTVVAITPALTRTNSPGDAQPSGLDAATLTSLAQQIASASVPGTDTSRIDHIQALETLKAACAAAQARLTAAFVASQRRKSVARMSAGLVSAPVASLARSDRDALAPTDVSDQAAMRAAAANRGDWRSERTAMRKKIERLSHRSASAEIALARKESPHRGGRFVGVAEALVHEMPCTFAALAAGHINERRAEIMVRETAVLTREQRHEVDRELDGQWNGCGDRRLAAMARAAAYRLDAAATVKRAAHAASERRVTLRPAPDSMAYLTALLPIGPAVACVAALQRAADLAVTVRSVPATRSQRIADELVARLTATSAASGQLAHGTCSGTVHGTIEQGATDERPHLHKPGHEAIGVRETVSTRAHSSGRESSGSHEAAPAHTAGHVGRSGAPELAPHELPPNTKLVINLVMSDETLFHGGDAPALLPGGVPIPAPLARHIALSGTDTATERASTWIRRVYQHPVSGELIAMESRSRVFTPAMRRLLIARDQTCRVPYRDAPARHVDHIVPHARGGPTAVHNGQALSEDCNYSRSAPGWRARREAATGDLTTTTPIGHQYVSHAPQPLLRTRVRRVRAPADLDIFVAV